MAAAGWLEVLMSAVLLAALACVLVASLMPAVDAVRGLSL